MLFTDRWQQLLIVYCSVLVLRSHSATSLSNRFVKALHRWDDPISVTGSDDGGAPSDNFPKRRFVVPFLLRGGSSSFVLDTRGGSDEMSCCGNDDSSHHHPTPRLILILDVDNTLYNEQRLRRTAGLGVEEQIIQNTQTFFLKYLNATSERSQELYRQYGSAIEGLRHEYWNQSNEEEMKMWMQRYYHQVYDDIDVSVLHQGNIPNPIDDTNKTGYTLGTSQELLRRYLESLSSHPNVKLYVASNSPQLHVDKVLRALGLHRITWTGVLTPDTVVEDSHESFVEYPTKHNPLQFFHKVLQQHSSTTDKIILLDDSLYNIRRVKEELGFEGIHVQHTDDDQDDGLLSALHQALSTLYSGDDDSHSYAFDDISYLTSKNVVDRASINQNVYRRVAHELAQRVRQSVGGEHSHATGQDQLIIIDLGAGLLNMLEIFLSPSDDSQISFFQSIQDMTKQPLQQVTYYAYESNQALLLECRSTLTQWGFEPVTDIQINNQQPQSEMFRRQQNDLIIKVHLKNIDFRQEQAQQDKVKPDLIVGCCFADLFQPRELLPALLSLLSRVTEPNSPTPLFYFPITFGGSTQFTPPNPLESSGQEERPISIPSDTIAFDYYARALKECGHNLDPSLLIDEMQRYGVELIDSGSSPWNIDPSHHNYFWHTMMHFFARSGAPTILQHGWDSFGWLRRAFVKRPKIVVSNVDLLFRLGDDSWDKRISNESFESNVVEEIQFVAPFRVTTIEKESQSTLLPNQIRVQSICSLISSGTELKIFKGMFNEDVLDVNIKGMSDQTMAYPLAYGYSMVGHVVECGSSVPTNLLGRLVFSFSPHATGMILESDSVHLVPEGITAEDAMFMPSVETALSIVHDAHVRLGENVAVYGQGLIGLLVTSILRLQMLGPDNSSGNFGTLTTFDTLTDRLAASGMLGASQALLPSDASMAGPFDVSIEVSGNPRALQAAIDHTADGGRIVVASWYGNADVSLKLGMDFHRSHKTIQTSQVSELPAALTGLWNKQRRFAFAWELVKKIRPSRLLTKRTTLANAQEAYEALCNGTEIAVAFEYENR